MPKMPGGKPTNAPSPGEVRQGAGAGGYPRAPKATKRPSKGLKSGSPMGRY